MGLLAKRLHTTKRFDITYPNFTGLINLDVQQEEIHVFNLIRKRYRQVVHGLFDYLNEEELLSYSRTYKVRYSSGVTEILSEEDAQDMLECKAQVLASYNATSEKVFFANDKYLEYLQKVLTSTHLKLTI